MSNKLNHRSPNLSEKTKERDKKDLFGSEQTSNSASKNHFCLNIIESDISNLVLQGIVANNRAIILKLVKTNNCNINRGRQLRNQVKI